MKFNLNKKTGLTIELFFEGHDCDCKYYNQLKEKKIFEGKFKQVYVDIFENFAFVGLGKKSELTLNKIREAFFDLAKNLQANNISEVQLELEKIEGFCTAKVTSAIVEGFKQAEYSFDRFLKDKKEHKEFVLNCSLNIEAEKLEKVQKSVN